MSSELRSLRSLEAQLRVERRLDAVLAELRPLRTYGRSRGREVCLLLHTLALRAPELLEVPRAAASLCAATSLRPVESWDGGTLWDLAGHLFVAVRYPLPGFLRGLCETNALDGHAVHALACVGGGGALTDLRGTVLPSSFTRRMAHELWLCSSADSWVHAVRKAQVAALGGPPELADLLMDTQLAHFWGRQDWWQRAIGWLVDHGPWDGDDLALAVEQLGRWSWIRAATPWRLGRRRLLDEARNEMAASHRSSMDATLPEAPFEGGEFYAHEVRWTVRPIRTAFELYLEGRVLHHCAATYLGAIKGRRCWLYSLRREGRRSITLEVTADGELVQAKGKCNRYPRTDEAVAIRRWAGVAGVEVRPLPGL